MDLKDLLTYLKECEDTVNAYWNFFAIVSLAIVGFIIQGSSSTGIPFNSLKIVTFAFIVFASANLFRMIKAQKQFLIVKNYVTQYIEKNKKDDLGDLIKGMQTNNSEPICRMTIFHLILDACVVIVIWY